jgi:hypothetical protein
VLSQNIVALVAGSTWPSCMGARLAHVQQQLLLPSPAAAQLTAGKSLLVALCRDALLGEITGNLSAAATCAAAVTGQNC